MKMIRMSGAGTLSVSWYPPGMADDEGQPWDDLMPLLLDTADKYKLKVTADRVHQSHHSLASGLLSY